jgi:hypothetical protein
MMVCRCPDATPRLRYFEWDGIAPVTLRSPFTRPSPTEVQVEINSGSRPLRNGQRRLWSWRALIRQFPTQPRLTARYVIVHCALSHDLL